jgi:hypothetical protein
MMIASRPHPAAPDGAHVTSLRQQEALGRGRSRLVFQHPRHRDRIIKVLRQQEATRNASRTNPFSRTARYGGYKVFAMEVEYLIGVAARRPHLLPLFPWIHGLIRTDLGLGMVQEKITDDRGEVAPSLAELARAGMLAERHRALVHDFLDRLEREHVVFKDLTARNIVAEGPREAPTRLVMIDGFGEGTTLPLRTCLPRYNRWYQRSRIAALRAELGLD